MTTTLTADNESYTKGNAQKIRIDREWEMPNKWTFEMKYVKRLLTEEIVNPSIDAFAGIVVYA